MESQYSLKQQEVKRLNAIIEATRQENFILQARSDNNEVKINNLSEQIRVKESERIASSAVHEQEIRQLRQQLDQDKSQSSLIDVKHRDDKVELHNLILSKEEEHAAQLDERE